LTSLSVASGTYETLVSSFYVSSSIYSSAVAMLGAQSINDTATLRVRNYTTTNIMLQLGGIAGILQPQMSTGSVTFPSTGWYDVYLMNSSISGSALCAGLKFIA
jgi:hypothetical protein